MNMEEKRKLEKVLFADIDHAVADYRANRSKARDALSKSVLQQPDVRAAYDLYVAAKKDMARHEKSLKEVGFRVDYYGDLGIDDAHKIEALREFDSESDEGNDALESLKRTYTLKLFAGGEEAQSLFATLAEDLARIVAR